MLKVVTALALALWLPSCSQSPFDQCVDARMAVWKQEKATYDDKVANWVPPYPEGETVKGFLDVEIPKNALVYPRDPGTEKQAESNAIMACKELAS